MLPRGNGRKDINDLRLITLLNLGFFQQWAVAAYDTRLLASSALQRLSTSWPWQWQERGGIVLAKVVGSCGSSVAVWIWGVECVDKGVSCGA